MIKLLGTNLSILYFFQIAIVIFLSIGILPLYYSWIIAAIAIYLFYKEPLEKCFYYFICSLPFFIATPIFSFESLSLWRPLSILLLIKYFADSNKIIKLLNYRTFFKSVKHKGLSMKDFNVELLLLIAFFVISFLGIFIAQDKTAAIKTILYYLNIALVGFLSWNIIKNKAAFHNAVKSIFISGFIILIIAAAQEISVFIVTLNQFWSFWAQGPSLAYYGQAVSDLLLVSNTWFSYWPGDFATLRAFSIFQDSHAFGLMMVFLLAISIYLLFNFFNNGKSNKRAGFFSKFKLYIIIVFSLLFIILSGTRGLWVAFYFILAPALLSLIYYFKNPLLEFIKKDIFRLIIVFTFCFFVASGFWFAQIYAQNATKSQDDILLAFKRIKSSFDLNEISNKGRIEIWKKSVEAAIKNPIIGVGPGNFPVALGEKISNVKKGASAHNLYLQFLVENGVLGLITVLFIFYRIFRRTYFTIQSSLNTRENIFALSFLIVFIWLLGYNLFDVALLNDKIFITFTILTVLLYKSGALTKFYGNS